MQAAKTPRLVFVRELQEDLLRKVVELCSRTWRLLQSKRRVKSNPKRLRLTETISLGEKRFVAVIQVDKCRFLIGGSATNVSLLTELDAVDSSRRIRKQPGAVFPLAMEKGGAV